MQREGTFCDLTATGVDLAAVAEAMRPNMDDTPCPRLAIGKCIGCGKDICDKHGSATALSVSIQRQPKDTSSHVEMTRGSIPMCHTCSTALERHKAALVENLVPVLSDAITNGIAALLASETMVSSDKSRRR